MEKLIIKIESYVKENIANFHNSRIEKLKSLKLTELLRAKNPYLYKAKDLNTAQGVVESLAVAFMSSAEESIFGNWLEGLAIYIATQTYRGRKSSAEGIDLEMERDDIHYLVSIKSGPKWSNSSSMKKLKENFAKAQRIYTTSGNKQRVEAIEGCCYGRPERSEKDRHTKLCGKAFWEFISGCESLYVDIIKPLGADALEKNQEYKDAYDRMINKFTKEFANEYCDENGDICWDEIVRLNSSDLKKKRKRKIR